MKNRTFIKILIIVAVVCILLTTAHVIYAYNAYQHSSIIEFIAKELW